MIQLRHIQRRYTVMWLKKWCHMIMFRKKLTRDKRKIRLLLISLFRITAEEHYQVHWRFYQKIIRIFVRIRTFKKVFFQNFWLLLPAFQWWQIKDICWRIIMLVTSLFQTNWFFVSSRYFLSFTNISHRSPIWWHQQLKQTNIMCHQHRSPTSILALI